MNLWDLLIVAVILAAVFLAVRSASRRNRGSCSCGCDNCVLKCGRKGCAGDSDAGQR